MRSLVALAGYDPDIVDALDVPVQPPFTWVGALVVASSGLCAIGMGYGGYLATGAWWVAVLTGLFTAFMVLNLYRLLHAGGGYPIHLPFEGIDRWRPSGVAVVVMLVLGTMFLQPFVLLTLRPALIGEVARVEKAMKRQVAKDHAALNAALPKELRTPAPAVRAGLIVHGRAAWRSPAGVGALTLVAALLFAGAAIVRRRSLAAMRAYEKERWIRGRSLVDDAYADSQDLVRRALLPMPGFSGQLAVHYADPPYNMRPMLYGIDPNSVEQGGVRFLNQTEHQPALPPPPRHPPPAPPLPRLPEVEIPELPDLDADDVEAQAPPAPAPPPLERTAEAPDEPQTASGLFDGEDEDDSVPPRLTYIEIGRLLPPRALRHLDEVAPFVEALTGRPPNEVRTLIRLAPPDMRMHRLFSEWTKLPVVLQHDAGFATEHELAPILALVVGKSRDEVEKRLRAAPPTSRLSRVFAPELARRVLGKKWRASDS